MGRWSCRSGWTQWSRGRTWWARRLRVRTRDTTEADRLWQEMGQLGMGLRPRWQMWQIPTIPTSPFNIISAPPADDRPPGSIRPIYPRPVRPVRPYHPYHPRPISPPLLPEERLQPASSLTIDGSSTSSHQLTPQQNSRPDSDVHLPPNPEPHSSAAAEVSIDEVVDMLKKLKIKRTLPAPVQ